jgi:5-hydroxyisourate hydrolase-like protein (transthyretin family)
VVDESGSPVAGAEVAPAFNIFRQFTWPADELAVTTAADGTFKTPPLPVETYLGLCVSKTGYAVTPVGVGGAPNPHPIGDLRAGESDVTVTLATGHALAGSVIHRDTGAPIAGATVHVQNLERSLFPDLATATDSEGRYHFEHLPAAYSSVVAESVDDLAGLGIFVQVGEVTDVEPLLLGPPATLHVQVVDSSTGEPARDLLVKATVNYEANVALRMETVQSDEKGQILLRLADGFAILYFEGLNADVEEDDANQRIVVTGGKTLETLTVRVNSHPEIVVTVKLPDGAPAAGATLRELHGMQLLTADAEGQVTVRKSRGELDEGAADRSAFLAKSEVNGSLHMATAAPDMTAAGKGALEITLYPTGGIAGQVADNTGAPLPGIEVSHAYSLANQAFMTGTVQTDAEGRFAFHDLSPRVDSVLYVGKSAVEVAPLEPGESREVTLPNGISAQSVRIMKDR